MKIVSYSLSKTMESSTFLTLFHSGSDIVRLNFISSVTYTPQFEITCDTKTKPRHSKYPCFYGYEWIKTCKYFLGLYFEWRNFLWTLPHSHFTKL